MIDEVLKDQKSFFTITHEHRNAKSLTFDIDGILILMCIIIFFAIIVSMENFVAHIRNVLYYLISENVIFFHINFLPHFRSFRENVI